MALIQFGGIEGVGDHTLVLTRDTNGAVEAQTVTNSPGVAHHWNAGGAHRVGVFAEYTQPTASKTLTVKHQISVDGSNWEDYSSNSFTVSSGSGGTARGHAMFTPPVAPFYRVIATQNDATADGTVKLRAHLTRL